MPEEPTCRRCGSSRVTNGFVYGYKGGSLTFTPEGLRLPMFTISQQVFVLPHDSSLCRDCGFIWLFADVRKLEEKGRKYGDHT